MLNKVQWVIASALLTTTAAWAGAQYESTLSSCTTINCSGMTIRGIQQSAEPFIIQVFARAGECMRLDVSSQTEDTAILLVAPTVDETGFVDDADGARPIFGLDPVPHTGWYTVAISYFIFDERISRFTLEYGRYPGGNLNCSQATATKAMAPSQLTPKGGSVTKDVKPAADSADATGQHD